MQDVIVDESMMPLTISFDRLRAILILLRTAFSLAAVVIFIWAGIAGFSKVIHEPTPQLLVNQFVLVPMLLAIFVPLAWYPLRYRETLFTTFNVSDSGLVIENSRYGVLVLGWHDVNGAVYSRLGRLIRLRSPKLATTVAIMRDHKASFSREFESARGMIRKGVREQWSEQWL